MVHWVFPPRRIAVRVAKCLLVMVLISSQALALWAAPVSGRPQSGAILETQSPSGRDGLVHSPGVRRGVWGDSVHMC